MISQETIEEVKRSADIVEIISEYVPGLKKSGSNYKALSPFSNEKTPSFVVSPEKQIFKDFSTGRGGSVFRFLQEYLNISFPESVELVADKIGIKIDKKGTSKSEISKSEIMRRALEDVSDYYHKNIFNSEIAYQYLSRRGFGDELVNTFQIGYSPDDWESTYKYLNSKNYPDNILEEVGIIKKTKRGSWYDYYKGRLIFPIRNKLGRTVGFGGRILKKDDQGPKYLNTPQTPLYDKSKILFGLFEAKDEIRNKNYCILVEGYADVVSLYQAGIKNVVASSGTALTTGQLDLLKNYTKKLYLIYDADKAGINAAEKGVELSIRAGFETLIVKLPEGEDPDSIVQEHGKNTFNEYLNKALDFVAFKKWVYEWKYGEMGVTHRSELIRSLISLIKSIPDRFKHSHYISRVETELSLSDLEKTYFYEELTKEKVQNQDLRNVELNNQEIPEIPKLIILDIEKYVFQYLIDHFSDFHKICEDNDLNESIFISEDARYIFNILENAPEDQNIYDYIENDESVGESEKNFIFDISLNREEVNKKLADEKSLEIDLSINFLKDTLVKLKLENLISESEQLIKSMVNDDNSQLLKRYSELQQIIEDLKSNISE